MSVSDEQFVELIKALEEQNRKNGLLYSFFHGVMSGLGATVGVAVVLGIAGYFLRELAIFPKLASEIRSMIPPKIQQTIQLPQDEIKIPIQQATPSPDTERYTEPNQSNL